MSYTSLFLDLDNTLLDFDKAEAVAVRQVLQNHALPSDDSAVRLYSAINKSFWERFERGEIPKCDIFEGRFCVLLESFHAEGDPKTLSAEYGQYLSKGYYTVDGTFDLLDYLKEKQYRLYAVTNGLSTTQYNRIACSGLKPYFDGVFVSEEAGFQKPEKEYFDYVIRRIPEKNKANILIIGDSQSSDILGALNAEIDACWFNPKKAEPRYPSKYEIARLAELKTIL